MATETKKRAYRPLMTEIVIKPPQRKTSDVGQWRTALKSADMGRMKMLYDLYEDLLIDGVLADAVDKRISAVTNSELIFQDVDGQEVPEINDLIDSPAFEELLTTIMHTRFWGRSAGEFDFSAGFAFVPIPHKHIKLETHSILINETDDTGIDYTGDDHILVIGKPRQFGLFLKTAPMAIWKRGGFGDYAQWLELFGMPQRIGKYSSYDPESRKILEQAMEKAGSAPWVVVPKETDIETVNNTGTGSSSSAHNDFRKACNEEILITILGQTMTTLDGSSRSQSETHKEVEEGKNRSDLRFTRRVLNSYVVPLLEKRGFPVSKGKFVFPTDPEPITVSDLVELSDILDIPASYLHNKYSIPVPKDGERIARRGASKPKPEDDPEGTPEGGKDDDPESDDNIRNADRRNFLIRLYDFFAGAPVQAGALNGNLLTLQDDNLHDRLIKRIVSGDTGFDPELFEWISQDLIRALDSKPTNLADLGFTYNYQNDAFRTAQELNLFHFSAAKDIAEIQRLNELYRQSKSFEDFYKAAAKELDVFNKDWQRTEWQTATLISASTDNYNRLLKKVKLFPYWEYKTVGDNKVRPEHRKLDGVILPANDPRWNKIWPPNGWKCRCYIVTRMAHEVKDINFDEMRARVDAYLKTPEWKQNEAQGFGVNRAVTPEVFTEDQMYINKFPDQASRLLKDVNYHTYGLKSYEQMRASATGKLPVYEGPAKDFIDGLKKEDGKSFFTDYLDRSIEFNEEVFLKGHSAAKYASRTGYLKAVSEALKTPDEVWINSGETRKTFDQFVFLKYYQDQVLAVIGAIDEGTVYRVKTWFPVSETAKSGIRAKRLAHKYKYRWGLLIKKPGV
jgi:SPP1 gp7 family putative phage head morphogenesis protein